MASATVREWLRRQWRRPLSVSRPGAVLGVMLVCALTLSLAGALHAQVPPSASVFEVVVMERTAGTRGEYHAVMSGTAFFVASDGRALTSSHVVYRAYRDPATYQVVAIVNREFYGVTVVAASPLPYDPSHVTSAGVPMSLDVAQIRVTEVHSSFLQMTFGGGVSVYAHSGRLPAFPALRLGSDPNIGDRVRVLGFGHSNSPVPYEWAAEGAVSSVTQASDGTPIFETTFSRPTEPGDSGAPVLNANNEVVGIWAWHDVGDSSLGTAIGSSALEALPTSW